MNVSLILAHPNPGSFNHAIAQAVLSRLKRNGYNVFFHDLYAERFDPVLPYAEFLPAAPLPESLQKYCQEVEKSRGMIIVHPNWWGQPPAILKGWVDRVLRPGVAYRFLDGNGGEGIPQGLLKGRAAIVFDTSNTPA
ncbi:MAG: NAD(P)H-dependent oxidoreductase, partial [Candidatus Aminicenantes bacterium]|nr:NAD(P)H-dependent oxidoreductase [Candidatus Aminicenantes bacterium]